MKIFDQFRNLERLVRNDGVRDLLIYGTGLSFVIVLARKQEEVKSLISPPVSFFSREFDNIQEISEAVAYYGYALQDTTAKGLANLTGRITVEFDPEVIRENDCMFIVGQFRGKFLPVWLVQSIPVNSNGIVEFSLNPEDMKDI